MKKTLLTLLLLYTTVVALGFGMRVLYQNDPAHTDRVARAELRTYEILTRAEAFPQRENTAHSFSLDVLDVPTDELIIEDVVVGGGRVATSGDHVAVHYRAMFENGEVFDSSRSPGRSSFQFQLGVGQVMRGWDEGILGMKVGGVRRLVIPPTKAFGSDGFGPVPGDATLIYEIELLSVFN